MGLAAHAGRVTLRAVLAAVAAAAVAGLATIGLTVTTASRAASLLLEPFSLLFVPGVALAIAWTSAQGHLKHHARSIADNHDFSAGFVLWCTFLLYFALFFWWQSYKAAGKTPPPRSR